MKKLLYTSLIALAGLFAASCQQEHIEVVYDPANVTVQTLGVFADAELAADGAALTTTFNPADFKLQVASGYTLYAAKAADMANKVKVSSSISIDENQIGHISIKQPAMNSLIFSLGGVAEEPFTVYFQLDGGIINAKKTTIASTVVTSNVVSATFTPYSTIILDKDLYPHVYPIGGIDILGSWSHDKVFQFVYDYNKSTDTYTGLLDLGEKHADGVEFKFTGEASWDDSTGNWGVDDDSAPEAEAGELQLKNSSNTNISQYGKDRFYMFSLNTNTLVLSKKYSFSNVGIVGAFNGWNQADPDMKMTYNIYLHRFYIDQTFAEDTELKFTCDDAWNLNWGGADGEIAGGGSNIAVEAGSYRVYLDLNHGTYELSTAMYGKDEPTGQDEPEPVKWEGWGVVGSINNWSAPDIHMTTQGDFWVAYNVELTASDQFKFRKDEEWGENIGAPGDVEPYIVEIGTKYEGAAGGKNLGVAADGKYDLYVNPTEKTFYVMKPGEVPGEIATWGVVGTITNWSDGGKVPDLPMTETDGMWLRAGVELKASDQIKVRFQNNWDINRGAPGDVEPFVMDGSAIKATAGGKNLGVAEDGTYDIYYDALNEVLFVVKTGVQLHYWGLVGTINNWGNEGEGYRRDFIMAVDGDMVAYKGIELKSTDQFKVRKDSNWDVNAGAEGDVEPFKVEANVVFDAKAGGKNLGVKVDGKYDVYYDDTNKKIYVMAEGVDPSTAKEPAPVEPEYKKEITVPGGYADWSPENDPKLQGKGDGIFKGALVMQAKGEATQVEFKFYHDGSWMGGALATETQSTKAETSGPTPIKYTIGGGDNMKIDSGHYFWTVDLVNKKAEALALTKVALIGKFNDWTPATEVVLTFDAESGLYVGTVTLVDDDQIKVRFNDNWDYCLGGTLDALSGVGDNISVTTGGTYQAKLDLNGAKLTLTAQN